jgi:hypothetical protein
MISSSLWVIEGFPRMPIHESDRHLNHIGTISAPQPLVNPPPPHFKGVNAFSVDPSTCLLIFVYYSIVCVGGKGAGGPGDQYLDTVAAYSFRENLMNNKFLFVVCEISFFATNNR